MLLCSIFISQFISNRTNAQVKPFVTQPLNPPPTPGPITGPTTVQQGQTATYSVAAVSGASSYSWSLSSTAAGTVSGSGTSVTVYWSASYSGYASVYCEAVNSAGSSSPSSLTVNVTALPPLVASSISPASQTISYNTVPKALTGTAATGGNGIYAYQWQSSPNGVIWTNISGATSRSYAPGALTVTAYYQLITTSNSTSANSNSVIVNVNQATNPANIDTTFNTAMNHIFGTLNTANVPFGLLRDYAMEFTNLENFNGTTLVDSNMIDKGILRSIYMTLATARMTGAATGTLPNPNTIDSLWQVARQPGQVTLCGLFYQYAYLASNADSTGKITVTNNQLFDKYVNGVWQNPYLQGQTVGFAPASPVYNALNFNMVLPANLWFTNSVSLVSKIQVDAGDGLGYRTITTGTPLPVMYADTGLKTWNFKVFLTNSTVLQSHSQVTVRGTVNNLTCYSAGCGSYTPPGGDSGTTLQTSAVTANTATVPADVISGAYPNYFFFTGATYNGQYAEGMVTLHYGYGHSSLINPLIVVEGFDIGYYTNPESYAGTTSIADFNKDITNSKSATLIKLLEDPTAATYDIVYITFKNGTDDIHRNALLVESVIRWVNANKAGNAKNVVLAQSMGGLCARYGLIMMEKNGETHQVRLFISHGTPEQGAVVPLGFQYLENHMNSFSMRLGFVSTLYSAIEFIGTSPNVQGLLLLTDAPAAKQMLVNRINDNFQLDDNTVHNAWQSELTKLGYPSQGGIRNVAISNGSECGQSQTLTQGGQLLYLDGKLHTGIVGDVLGMIGFPVIGAFTSQPAFLVGVIPGRNDLLMHFAANAAIDGGGNQIYTGKITYKKTILWLIPVSINLTSQAYNAPSQTLPYETFAGDYYASPFNPVSLSNSITVTKYNIMLAKYNLTFAMAPSFGFVPTPSVLDIGQGSTSLLESDYSVPYTQGFTPVSQQKNTSFTNFITAYSLLSPLNVNNNERHIRYETRNGDWLANELTTPPTIADCNALCQINSIAGQAVVCNEATTYSVTNYSNATYNWSTSSNLKMLSQQGMSYMQVQPFTAGSGQPATITVNISGKTDPDCGTITINKTITIGVEPLVVTSTVDRTVQTSHYQYLTATATQLPNTVASNYSWYLLVNNQPTTLIGTGLQLTNYPIAPCTTIYYQCQAVTPCGISTYNGYAYNTYCSGTTAMTSQSVVIYPNPADNTMTVTNNNIPATTDASGNSTGIVPQSYQIIVYNNTGNILRSAQNANGNSSITFATGDIANGNYFLHVIQGNNVIEKQIIIQH